MNNLLHKIIEKQNLEKSEAETLMNEIMLGKFSPTQIAAILTALRMKGETLDELSAFISVMRKNMIKINAPVDALDTCGTGGDNAGTFNISTTVAIVVAAAGAPVVKHGNRAASSKSGSADVLEKLGVNIFLRPADAEDMIRKTNFVFLFAPLYHPSMKYVAPVRKELGFKTVFNFLGPFANPASAKRQIIGVPDIEIAKRMADVAAKLDYVHVCIVSSHDGLDELSISSNTEIFEVKNSKIARRTISSELHGIEWSSKESLQGKNAEENAAIIHSIFSGEKGPKRDVVLLNAAYALYVSGKTASVNEGVSKAIEIIDKGYAKKKLEEIVAQSQLYEKYTG